MKKFLFIFVCALMLIVLCGCGQREIHYVTKTVEVEKIVEVPVEVEKIVEVQVPYDTYSNVQQAGAYVFSRKAEAEGMGTTIPDDFIATFENGTPIVIFGVNTYSVFRSAPDTEKEHILYNIYYNKSTDDPNVLVAAPKTVTCYGSYGDFVLINFNGKYGWIKSTGISVYGDITGTAYKLDSDK